MEPTNFQENIVLGLDARSAYRPEAEYPQPVDGLGLGDH